MIVLPLLILLTATKPLHQHAGGVPVALHKTKDALKVYQTPQQSGSLTVHSSAQGTIAFYLFDLEGNLVYESRLQQDKRQTIEGLRPGPYTYQAFDADEEIKGGKVSIKN